MIRSHISSSSIIRIFFRRVPRPCTRSRSWMQPMITSINITGNRFVDKEGWLIIHSTSRLIAADDNHQQSTITPTGRGGVTLPLPAIIGTMIWKISCFHSQCRCVCLYVFYSIYYVFIHDVKCIWVNIGVYGVLLLFKHTLAHTYPCAYLMASVNILQLPGIPVTMRDAQSDRWK